MGKEYTTRSFKSGNSVAIRIPAALGIEPDIEWIVAERDGDLVIRPKSVQPTKIDLDGVYGSLKGIRRLPVDDTERSWRGISSHD